MQISSRRTSTVEAVAEVATCMDVVHSKTRLAGTGLSWSAGSTGCEHESGQMGEITRAT